MSRRRRARKSEILPDVRYGDVVLSKFINVLMLDGKKSVAERIVYRALETAGKDADLAPLDVFHQALEHIAPEMEVRRRRVGGATYQVPVEVQPERARGLAFRWLIEVSHKRAETTMAARLAGELGEAAQNRGGAVKRKSDTHKVAESNRAFSHYRW